MLSVLLSVPFASLAWGGGGTKKSAIQDLKNGDLFYLIFWSISAGNFFALDRMGKNFWGGTYPLRKSSVPPFRRKPVPTSERNHRLHPFLQINFCKNFC